MSKFLSLPFDIGMAIGPILGYVYQYRLIKINQSVGSFSIDICAILIFANILRLNFYLFEQFETALVFQSIFMTIMQIFLLHLCAKFNPRRVQVNMASQMVQSSQGNLDEIQQQDNLQEHFWRWQNFCPYAVTIIILVLVSFSISLIMRYAFNFAIYGEIVGIFALVSESILIAPQIIKNIRMGTTKGLSYMLVFLNLTGDILKLVYFLLKSQPFQFILCGIIQVCLDSFVVGQIIYYRIKQKRNNKQKFKTSSKASQWVEQEFDKHCLESKNQESSSTIQITHQLKQVDKDDTRQKDTNSYLSPNKKSSEHEQTQQLSDAEDSQEMSNKDNDDEIDTPCQIKTLKISTPVRSLSDSQVKKKHKVDEMEVSGRNLRENIEQKPKQSGSPNKQNRKDISSRKTSQNCFRGIDEQS